MCLTWLCRETGSHARDWSRAIEWASRPEMRPRICVTLTRMCWTIGAESVASAESLWASSSSSASAHPSITLSGLFRSWATVPANDASDSRWVLAVVTSRMIDHGAVGAPSACGTGNAETSSTRATPYSSMWWISSASTTSPAMART